MIVTRYGHACLLIETASTRVLVDPGVFSTTWHQLTGLDAILITHQHPDHVDVANLPALVAANQQAKLIAEAAVAGMVSDLSPETAQVGEAIDLGEVSVEVLGGEHALLHPRIPRVGNVGYLFREGGGPSLFHPGDSYDVTPSAIDLLALPLVAPWASAATTIDFANTVAPARAIPIHDAFLADTGKATWMRICGGAIDEAISIDDPAAGEPYTL
jgi:L-ascorbate metabolism protein UlaG (beta-lactamase superfamily)